MKLRSLAIDAGNSAVKLTLWHDRELTASHRLADLDPRAIADMAGRVDRVVLSSVRAVDDAVVHELERQVAPVLRLDATTPLPITNGYATPDSLGADRLAAAVGAREVVSRGDLLVADLGTAATFDYLRHNDIYVGGNIAPGLAMRLDALHRYTARLPRVALPETGSNAMLGTPFGLNTDMALLNGALLGLAAELTFYRRLLSTHSGVVLTGGDAPRIAPLLAFDVVIDPHLVGRGLNSILLYNEQ